MFILVYYHRRIVTLRLFMMNTLDLIYLQNPWFRDSSAIPQERHWPRRKLYDVLVKDLDNSRQALAITGLRRVGKSTLLKQLISHLLELHVAPKRILYFTFDQPAIAETTGTIEEVIRVYIESIVGATASQLSERVWIVLDEVQLIPLWQDILKRYYDVTDNIKFIITGSAALFLTSASKESLAGRFFQYTATPLTFTEYQQFAGDRDMVRFLEFGQYPELLTFTDRAKQIEYLRDAVVGRVLEIDIPKLFGVRKIVDFERLFWTLLPNCGQIIKTASFGAELGLKKSTLFKYLSILNQSLLTNTVTNMSGSFRSTSRLLRKIYPASSNFLSLSSESVSLGARAEIYVYMLLSQLNTPVYLYRKRDKEIDFVLPDKKLAVEVKFQSQVHASDLRTIRDVAAEKQYQSVIVTKDDDRVAAGIQFVSLANFEEWIVQR